MLPLQTCVISVFRMTAALAVALGSLAGCSREPPQAVPIAVGEARCSECGMLIAAPEFAGEIVGTRPAAETFDDIGCLVRRVAGKPLAGGEAAFVTDYQTGAFVDATRAAYLRTNAVATPMHSGLLAFATKEAAETARAQHGGTVLTWKDLPELYKQPSR